jgi:CheY-like chemotaxis protein
VAALRGAAGLALAWKHLPQAVALDLRLPDMDGWAVFDRLKHDPRTRHIPVLMTSGDDERDRGLSQGAFGFLVKPIPKESLEAGLAKLRAFAERTTRRLLVVEDNADQRKSVIELLSCEGVEATEARDGASALKALRAGPYDLMVLDLRLPDISGFELIERLKKELGEVDLPIIVYTGRALTKREERELKKVTHSVIVKDAGSPERLLQEAMLFLHQSVGRLTEVQRRMLEEAIVEQPLLAGKTVLIVDDDVRNIFALTSVLERYNMKVVYAENGKEGLESLGASPDTDIVLMDVMMPGMDGYETMRAIRRQDAFKELPIIALTAKAMKGDREKCIEAGASDYIPKPVDVEQLLSLLRVWLYRYEYAA